MIVEEFIIIDKPVFNKRFDNDGELYKELTIVCATEQLAENVFRHLTLSSMVEFTIYENGAIVTK